MAQLYAAKSLLQSIETFGDPSGVTVLALQSVLDGAERRNVAFFMTPDSFVASLMPGVQSSEVLLAMVVVTAGAMGAVIAGFRSKQKSILKDLALGVASGFVTYLAVRGGKYVFLVEHSTGSFSMNPYGCAFAGLLAGLFTERVYTLLGQLVDSLSKRLITALK